MAHKDSAQPKDSPSTENKRAVQLDAKAAAAVLRSQGLGNQAHQPRSFGK